MSIFTITATGNFRYSEDSCQNLIDCVEAGIPVEIVPVTLMGLIAPVTIVGATVFHTVDVLAGITMAQIVRPGAPVLFGGAPATFHMKIASSPMSAIEALQLDAAYVAVAKSLGLPTQSYMALSDGPILDAQAGAETFGSALIAALAGVNSVSGPGHARLPARLQPAQARLRRRDVRPGAALRPRGRARTTTCRSTELIDQLMADQHLIMAPHTTAHWPTELYLPSSIVDRDNREAWMKARVARTPTSAPATRSTGGSPPTASSRPTRRSTPSCAASSGPGSWTRRSCRASRSPPSRSPPRPGPVSDATTGAASRSPPEPAGGSRP